MSTQMSHSCKSNGRSRIQQSTDRRSVELLDEAEKTIRAYQNLLSGKSDAFELLDQVQALEKLGVTEGTLAEL